MTAVAAPPARGLPRGLRFLRSGPARLVRRRVLTAIPVLWGVTLLTFIVLNLLPGDAASELLGATATPGEVQALRLKLHLNEPFLERYWHWLSGVLTGNLGSSLASGQPVATVLGQRLPVTAELVAFGFVISLVVAVPVAVLSARRPSGLFDRLSLMVSMTGLSVAPYVLALVLVLVFAVKLGWLPALGWVPLDASIVGNLKSLVMPAVSIGFPLGCFYTRLLRADIIEQMTGEEYVVAARAKGLAPWRLLTRHALRNSLFGLITVVGLNIGTIFGGTVILEEIFGLPGIGQELFQAIQNRDVPALEGIVVVFALIVVVVGLLADLLYSVLDPRIRYGDSTH
jgi:peptide/nickel transport system permease protein